MDTGPSLLVLRLSSLGDVLFALPAVQVLRASGHWSRLAWLVEDRAAGILRELFPVDELIVFPRRRKLAWPAHMAALRRRRDDVVLDLQSSFKSHMQRLFLRPTRSVGFDAPIAREGAERSLDVRFVPPTTARHRIDSNLSILAALGLEPPARAPRPDLQLPDGPRAGPDDGRPVVVLHPGTSAFGAFKRWAPAAFARVADALVRERGAHVLVSGPPAERPLVDAVLAAMRTKAERLPGSGLGDFAARLARADLLIAADSFPLHLANALGTPVVGLYGPKDPRVNGPYWDRSRVVTSGWDCSPCTLRRCADAPCMDRLASADVLAAARVMLDGGRT